MPAEVGGADLFQHPQSGIYLFPAQLHNLARQQRFHGQMAQLYAHQPQCRKTNGGGHPPDLAVLAFGECEFNPAVGHRFAVAYGWIPLREYRGLNAQTAGGTREIRMAVYCNTNAFA